MRLCWTQLALNLLWSPTFFATHWVGLALAVVLLLLATALAFIARGLAAGPRRGAGLRALRQVGGLRLGP